MEKLRATSGRRKKTAVVVRRDGLGRRKSRRDICKGARWYGRRPRGIMRPRYGDMVVEVWGVGELGGEMRRKSSSSWY